MVDEIVTAAQANRSFSRLLRGVREEGRSYVVTAHGRPVARLMPVDETTEVEERFREAARRELFRRLEKQPAQNIGKWTRDELYDE